MDCGLKTISGESRIIDGLSVARENIFIGMPCNGTKAMNFMMSSKVFGMDTI